MHLCIHILDRVSELLLTCFAFVQCCSRSPGPSLSSFSWDALQSCLRQGSWTCPTDFLKPFTWIWDVQWVGLGGFSPEKVIRSELHSFVAMGQQQISILSTAARPLFHVIFSWEKMGKGAQLHRSALCPGHP